jgi:hypothetical protein
MRAKMNNKEQVRAAPKLQKAGKSEKIAPAAGYCGRAMGSSAAC